MDQTNSRNSDDLFEVIAPNFFDGYVSEDEYAAQRGLSRRTCQRHRQLRESPPFVRFGRSIYYRVAAVREWLMRHEQTADRTLPARRGRA